MSIVATEIESVHGAVTGQRVIWYRCQDHLGAWHPWGPQITNDPSFDPEGHKASVAEIVAEQLAEAEARELVG